MSTSKKTIMAVNEGKFNFEMESDVVITFLADRYFPEEGLSVKDEMKFDDLVHNLMKFLERISK